MKEMEFLESVRSQYGNEQMRSGFYSLFKRDASRAMRVLNDDALRFPWLYILRPEIMKLALDSYLNNRNHLALAVTKGLTSPKQARAYALKPEHYPVLKWMLQTGHTELDLGDEYDRVMDFTAILLARENHDKASLKPIEEIIFSRNRKGLNAYDAEWAFFESRDPDCLAMVAERLRATEPKDVELARRLLGFIPCFEANTADPVKQYQCVMRWINDNKPYLRYTGESSLKGWNPRRFEVLQEFKYLQKPLTASGELPPLSSREQSRINEFTGLKPSDRELLSAYSQRLHRSSRAQWDKWMQLPLIEQIESARQLQEGASQ
ncbi:MAG: hypothetical protein ACOYU3_10060 [Bacillota bacterium]